MKLRWYNRLLLVLASLFILIEAIGLGLLALGMGHQSLYNLMEMFLQGHFINRVILCVVSVLLLVVGVRLLFLRARPAPGQDLIFMCTTDAGTIRITPAAVESLVQRAGRNNAHVRDLKVKTYQQDNALHVQLRVVIAAGATFKEVSQELQTKVREELETNTGIPVSEVQVIIEAAPAPAAQPKVE